MLSQGQRSDEDEDHSNTSDNQSFTFSMTGMDRTNVALGNAVVDAEENTVLENLHAALDEDRNPVQPTLRAPSDEPVSYPVYTGGGQNPFHSLVRQQPSTRVQLENTSANLGQPDFYYGYQDPLPTSIPNRQAQNPFQGPDIDSQDQFPTRPPTPQVQNPSQRLNSRPPTLQQRAHDHAFSRTNRSSPSPFHQQPNVGPTPGPSHQNQTPWNIIRPRGRGFLNRGSSRLAKRRNDFAGAPTPQSNFVPGRQLGQPPGSRKKFLTPPRRTGGTPSQLAPLSTQNLGKRNQGESSKGSTPSSSDVRRGTGARFVRPRHDEPRNAEDGNEEQDMPQYPMGNLRPGSIIFNDGLRYVMQADGTFCNIPAPAPAAQPAPGQNPPPPPRHVRRQSAHPGGDTYIIENRFVIDASQYLRQHDPPVDENEGFMPPSDHAPSRRYADYNRGPSHGTPGQDPLPSYGPGYGDQNHYYHLGLRGPGRGHGLDSPSSSNPYGSPPAPNYDNVPPHGSVPNIQPRATGPYPPYVPKIHGQHRPPPPPLQTPINPSNMRKPSQQALEKEAKTAGRKNKRQANIQRSTGNGKGHLVVAPPGFPSVPSRGGTSHDVLLDTARNRPEDFVRLYPNDIYDYYGWIVARGLGNSSNFYACFRKHHQYDKYIMDGSTPWRNSLGKKIAWLGKYYFGLLPGWGYIERKEERLSDFVEADNWLENGKPTVKFGKMISKEENVVETAIEEDLGEGGFKYPEDDEGHHRGGASRPAKNHGFDEPDAEASTTRLDPNLDPSMLEYQMTPQHQFPTQPRPLDLPPPYHTGPQTNTDLYGSDQYGRSHNPSTEPNPATQAGHAPGHYGNTNPESGTRSQSVQEWIEQTQVHAQMQPGTGHRNYPDENFPKERRLQQAALHQPPAEEEEGNEDEDAEFELDSEYDAARPLPAAASDQIQTSNPVQDSGPSSKQCAP